MSNEEILFSWIDIGIKGLNIAVILFLGFYGLHRWKQEKIIADRYEIAKKLLVAFFNAHFALEQVRKRIIFPEEIIDAVKEYGVELSTNHEKNFNLQNAAVYRQKWNKFAELYNKLNYLKLEADILLGLETKKIFSNYDDAVRELSVAVETIITNYDDLSRGVDVYSLRNDMLERSRKILYPRDLDNDELGQKLFEGISIIEQAFSPFIRLEHKSRRQK